MKLLIGNRNYSSWSLRAWLVAAHFEIPFEAELLQLTGPGYQQRLHERSPTGKVPVLIDGDVTIPETIAIIEYLAELYPDLPIWPGERIARAAARAACAEMHASFFALRSAAPMNLRASLPGRVKTEAVYDDLRRIETLWGTLLETSGGPYLFGAFTAADAMFAPVATRIRTYDLPASDTVTSYVEAIYALPAFQAWLAEAVREPWIIEEDEIDLIRTRQK